MSDTHPRYIVAEGERFRFGEYVLEYQVVEIRDNGNARVIHGGFVEDFAARIAEALNDHPKVEQLEKELRRQALLHEQARIKWAEQQDYSDAALRAKADGYARYGTDEPAVTPKGTDQ